MDQNKLADIKAKCDQLKASIDDISGYVEYLDGQGYYQEKERLNQLKSEWHKYNEKYKEMADPVGYANEKQQIEFQRQARAERERREAQERKANNKNTLANALAQIEQQFGKKK